MDAVLGVLSSVAGVVTTILNGIGKYSIYLFLGSFFGLLTAFLWFFFRWLDLRRVALSVIVFFLFFAIFLGSSTMLLLQDSGHLGGAVADAADAADESAASAQLHSGAEDEVPVAL